MVGHEITESRLSDRLFVNLTSYGGSGDVSRVRVGRTTETRGPLFWVGNGLLLVRFRSGRASTGPSSTPCPDEPESFIAKGEVGVPTPSFTSCEGSP